MGHDAKRAVLVAPLHDADKSSDLRRSMTAVRITPAAEQMLLDRRFAALLLFDLDNLVARPAKMSSR